MSKELGRLPAGLPLLQEAGSSDEALSRPPRFLVLGTRIAGSFDLHDLLVTTLHEKDIVDADVDVNRFIDHIDDAFFDRNHAHQDVTAEADMTTLELPAAQSTKRKLTPGLGHALLRRFVRPAAEVVTQGEAPQISDEMDQPTNIPAAVFVLPEMRVGYDGMHTTVPTPYEQIDDLCEQYGVPVIRVERSSEQAEIAQEIRQITA